jgi:hypothetical protein
MKRILYIGDAHSQFIYNLVKWIHQHDPEYCIDIINTKYKKKKELKDYYCNVFNYEVPEYITQIPFLGKLFHIQKILKILKTIPYRYEAVHFHFARTIYIHLLKEVGKITDKKVLTVWGSDFYSVSDHTRKRLGKLLAGVDTVTFANEEVRNQVQDFYSVKKSPGEFRIAKFGLEPLEYLNKNVDEIMHFREELDLPEDRIIISLGYNGNPIQQHLKILRVLKEDKEFMKYKDRVFIIVPVTYGGTKEYVSKVEKLLKETDLPYKMFLKFLTEKEIAAIRVFTDILIQLQLSDQFSGSMQEHLFAGGVVITGSWLPYSTFKNEGVYFRTIGSLDQCSVELRFVIDSLDDEKMKCRENKEKIYKLSSWSGNVESWIDLYNS